LRTVRPEWYPDPAVCVVLSAGGYPGSYETGTEIRGLEKLKDWSKGFVFHAGTSKESGRWQTSGGRVLGVTARGGDLAAAVQEVYRGVNAISWDRMHYRRDIARRAL
jgi:phosphoribosylamine---glycine ligase